MASLELQRLLEGRYTPAEQAAASASGDPEAWHQRQGVATYLSEYFEEPPESIHGNFDAWMWVYGGQGADPKATWEHIQMLQGQGPLQPPAKAPSLDSRFAGMISGTQGEKDTLFGGEMFRRGLAQIGKQQPGWQFGGEGIGGARQSTAMPDRDARTNRFAEAATGSAVVSVGTLGITGLTMAGWKDTAREAAGWMSAMQKAMGPTEHDQMVLDTTHGWKRLLTAEYYTIIGGQMVGSSLPMMLASYGMTGWLAKAGMKAPWLANVLGRVPKIGPKIAPYAGSIARAATGGAVAGMATEALSTSGEIALDAAGRERQLAEMTEAVGQLPPAERDRIVQAAAMMTYDEAQQALLNARDPELVAAHVKHSLPANLAICGFGGALEMAAGSAAFKAFAAGSRLAALVPAAVGLWSESEQEQYQTITGKKEAEALLMNTVAAYSGHDLLPIHTAEGIMGRDPEALDIFLATLFVAGRGAFVQAFVDVAQAGSYAEAAERVQNLETALSGTDATQAPVSKALLAGLQKAAEGKTGVAALNAKIEYLHSGAQAQVDAVQREVTITPPAKVGQIDPDEVATRATAKEAEDLIGQAEEHRDALEGPGPADKEAPAAPQAEPEVEAAAPLTDSGIEGIVDRALAPVAASLGQESAQAAEPAAPASEPAPQPQAAPKAKASPQVTLGQNLLKILQQQNPDAKATVNIIGRADIPAGVKARQKSKGQKIEGWTDVETGDVFIVADNLTPARLVSEVMRVWGHEHGHVGLTARFADDPTGLSAFLGWVQKSIDAEALVGLLDRTGQDSKWSAENPQAAFGMAATEYLADLAGKVASDPASLNPKQKGIWGQAVEMVRHGLRNLARQVGMDLKLTDEELQDIAVLMLRRAGVKSVPRFDGATAKQAKPQKASKAARKPIIVPMDEMPAVGFLWANGGVTPKGRARKPGGEYDGQPHISELGSYAQAVFAKEGGLSPDQAAAMMAERGLIDDAYPDTMWEAVKAEVKAQRWAAKAAKVQAKADRADDKAQATADREKASESKLAEAKASIEGRAEQPVSAADIQDGDRLLSAGEWYTADVDESGMVTLKDGKDIELAPFDDIPVAGGMAVGRDGEARRVEPQGGEIAFSLAPMLPGGEDLLSGIGVARAAQYAQGILDNPSSPAWLKTRAQRTIDTAKAGTIKDGGKELAELMASAGMVGKQAAPMRAKGVDQQQSLFGEKPQDRGLLFSLSPDEADALMEKAVDYFGTTEDPSEAGYVLPDGRMLDLSGRHDASGYKDKKPFPGQPDYLAGQRSIDHRQIAGIFGNMGGTDAMVVFQRAGAMRVDAFAGLIDMEKAPTARQMAWIEDALSAGAVCWYFDMYDGRRRAHVEPVEGAERKALGAIRRFYAGEDIAGGVLFSLAAVSPMGFYSQVARTVDGAKQAKAPGAQWLAWLRNQPGIKAEELDWLGLPQWLAEQQGPVTKEALAGFVEQNQVRLEEVTKGGLGFDGRSQRMDDLVTRENAGTITDEERAELDVLEEQVRLGSEDRDDTKFSRPSLNLPGGENYRELLLTLGENAQMAARRAVFQEYAQRLFDINRAMLDTRDRAESERLAAERDRLEAERDARAIAAGGEGNSFHSTHWDEGNILAHVRFNERTDAEGKRVLFVEEVQSDWHQKGREEGYGPNAEMEKAASEARDAYIRKRAAARELGMKYDGDPTAGAVYSTESGRRMVPAEPVEISPGVWAVRSFGPYGGIGPERATSKERAWGLAYRGSSAPLPMTEGQYAAWQKMLDAQKAAHAAEVALSNVRSVPDAPFKTTWPLLAMKRMIRWAAGKGFDRLGWTTGEQQAERYDLSKQVSKIRVRQWANDQTMGTTGNYSLDIRGLDGEQIGGGAGFYDLPAARLSNIVGKDLANRIIAEVKPGPEQTTYQGLDLKVGGEGMKGFYDVILPAELNKYVKRWGGRAGEGSIPSEKWNGPGKWIVKYDTEAGWEVWDTKRNKRVRKAKSREDAAAIVHGLESSELPLSVHALDITPAMREAALGGQVLFSLAPAPEGEALQIPPAEADMLSEDDYFQAVYSRYDDGTSSRTTPVTELPTLRVGMWRVSTMTLRDGRTIDQLRWLDPRDIEVSERMVETNEEGRGWDADRYAQWASEGKQAPPIEVLETDEGTLRVTNGHRRTAAHKKLGRPVLAWVSPAMDLLDGGRYNSDPAMPIIKTALTYEAWRDGKANRTTPLAGGFSDYGVSPDLRFSLASEDPNAADARAANRTGAPRAMMAAMGLYVGDRGPRELQAISEKIMRGGDFRDRLRHKLEAWERYNMARATGDRESFFAGKQVRPERQQEDVGWTPADAERAKVAIHKYDEGGTIDENDIRGLLDKGYYAFSLAPEAPLGPRERVLAAAVADLLMRGRSIGAKRIAARLTDIGESPDAAESVLDDARRLAEEFKTTRMAAAGDRDILAALIQRVLQEQYAQNIASTGATAAEQQRQIDQAYRRLDAWKAERVRRLAEKRSGLTDKELEAVGQKNLETRLTRVIADYAPKKVERPAPAADEPQGPPSAMAAPRDPEDFDAAPNDEARAEAAALAPLPEVLPEDPVDIAKLKPQIVEAALAKLKREGYVPASPNLDPVLRREVGATWARLLRNTAWGYIRPGARREWLREAFRELELAPPTLKGLDRRVSQLAYWVGRAAERTDAEAFMRQLNRLLNLKAVKGATSQREELIRRKIEPQAKAWLRLVNDVVELAEETAQDHSDAVKALAADWSRGAVTEEDARRRLATIAPSLAKESIWTAAPVDDIIEDVARALSGYGALKHRPPAEIATAIDQLREDYENGLARIETLREARRERLRPAMDALVTALKQTPEQGKGAGAAITSFLRGTLGFYNLMRDLVRFAGPGHAAAIQVIDNLAYQIQAAEDAYQAYVAKSRQALEEGVTAIYGAGQAEEQLRRLEEPADAFVQFSRNPLRKHRLSRGNLLFIVASLEQADYARNAEKHGRGGDYLQNVRAALDPQDLELLDWLRGWYRSNREELSAKSMEVLGVPVLEPDPLYHPGRVKRDAAGLAEVHFTLHMAPNTMEARRRHQWDIDEEASPIGLFHTYVENNARFLTHADLQQDLRYLFGHPDMRKVLTEFAGKEAAGNLLEHVTEIAAGRAMGSTGGGEGALAAIRAATTLAMMSFNAGSGLRQLSGLASFGLTVGLPHLARTMAWQMVHPGAWREAVKDLHNHPAFMAWSQRGYSEPVDNAMRRGPPATNAAMRAAQRVARFQRLGMAVNSMGNRGAVYLAAPGIYAERRKAHERKGFTPEAAREKALAEIMWMVHQTQGSSQIAMLSKMWRYGGMGGEAIRMGMQFMGQAALQTEFEVRALRELAAQPSAERARKLANVAITLHVVFPAAYLALDAAFKYLRGDWDDDPDEAWEKLQREALAMFILGPWSALLFFGGFAEYGVRQLVGLRGQWESSPAGALAARVGMDAAGLIKHITADFDLEEALEDFDEIATKLSAPYRDIKKFAKQRLAD